MSQTVQAGAPAQASSRPSIWNPANIITVVRIGLVPVVAALLYAPQGEVPSPKAALWAGVVFLIAFLGDAVDGYLARRYSQITPFGMLLDPLADKLMILVVLVMLVPSGWVPAWLVGLILYREVFITGLRAAAVERGVVIASTKVSKYKTVYQSAAVLACILHYRAGEILGISLPPALDVHFGGVGLVLLYAAALVSIWSGVDYLFKFWKELTRADC